MTDKGFTRYQRQDPTHRAVDERVHDFHEMGIPLTPDQMRRQAERCMDCGVPFCNGFGCPLLNRIPEFNEMIYKGQWKQACENLHSTNNFPEITGRVCPALCEAACTLGINYEPVTIRQIELQAVEEGFRQEWIQPIIASEKTGKKVAIIGSGPSGLAAAQQLVRAGHSVTVFEKSERAGGLLRYGIPDFKLEKGVIDRRLEQLKAEGIDFQTGVTVGTDISANYLHKMFDCICLTMGANVPRDLAVVGRDYDNIVFAMDYLSQQNKQCSGEEINDDLITAKDKHVVVIGGGDTGSDCVGTARRQGAKEIWQLEILPQPPENRPPDTPWPFWPRIMRQSTSHEEGCERRWSVMTKQFTGSGKRVEGLEAIEVEWTKTDGQWKAKELEGTEFALKADLVLLALGFVHVAHEGLIKELGLETDGKGNLKADNFQTSQPWVFAAGDSVTGASLVVRAIDAGRKAADAIDNWLAGTSTAG